MNPTYQPYPAARGQWVKVQDAAELATIMQQLVTRLELFGRGSEIFAQAQMALGLRSAEVIERERWSTADPSQWWVRLAKGDQQRPINPADLPAGFRLYVQSRPGIWSWTYAAYLRDLQATGLTFSVHNGENATASHIFRYNRFRQLQAQGLSSAQVATLMQHRSKASTEHYLTDDIFYQDNGPAFNFRF